MSVSRKGTGMAKYWGKRGRGVNAVSKETMTSMPERTMPGVRLLNLRSGRTDCVRTTATASASQATMSR